MLIIDLAIAKIIIIINEKTAAIIQKALLASKMDEHNRYH